MLALFTVIAGYGFYLFLKNGIINYITFKTHFAFLDYEKPAALVFFENVSMLIFFAFVAHNLANALKGIGKKDNSILRFLVYVMTAIILGFILNMSIGATNSNNDSWQSNTFQNFEITNSEDLINIFECNSLRPVEVVKRIPELSGDNVAKIDVIKNCLTEKRENYEESQTRARRSVQTYEYFNRSVQGKTGKSVRERI